ncbi:sporulation protein YqfD [Sporanaerobium hydrogeniformans]|uniref:Sporulation protein YqfD n=1 Tax=Sporanaerobium hydrogeniformans TaxID=3072179 RepID=A0AC61DF37_9FIRM|nr:sporulation protein YqfD [Sporanaerobium hydrogeniformans]PHV71443.1 sporulation protein YqfD [Sporanaerobium hydrogeniformans]
MFVGIWNYLRGYVIVEVRGLALERFINLAVHGGIYLWDVKKQSDRLCFKISIGDFKKLKPYAKKSRCKLHIARKIGIPFKLHRYKKRKVFTLGIFVFIAILWALSSFIWLVDVEGNEQVQALDIVLTLEEAGYGVGQFKPSLNLRQAEALLVNKYPEIIWTGIKFQGTRLVVQVSEMVKKPEMHTDHTPCHLVAKRDALVTYIATYKGKPYVKKGDIVKKGEVLVSGQMPLGPDNPNLYVTQAKAQIKGKTFYRSEGAYQLEQVEKNYTSRSNKKWSFKFFNQRFVLKNQKNTFKNWDSMITCHQLSITKLFPLPFALEVEERVEYEPIKKKITEEEAKDYLTVSLWEAISKQLSPNAEILKREIIFTKNGNAIHASFQVVAEEDIGYAIELQAVELQNEGDKQSE